MSFVCTALAHPFHISTAEIEFNPKTNRLEVGLKLQAADLEQALAAMTGQRLKIEDSSSDAAIVEYLARNFYIYAKAPSDNSEKKRTEQLQNDDPVVAGGGKTLAARHPPPGNDALRLIGKEFETSWLWLYFELKIPAGEMPLVLIDRVLTEVNSQQINTCTIRVGGERKATKATAAHPIIEIDRRWLKVPVPK